MRVAMPLAGLALVLAPGAEAQVLPPSGAWETVAPAAAQPCTACHGLLGAGDPTRAVPRIAGLPRFYIEKQLRSFANGTRRNAAMEAIARSLSPADVDVVTSHFARLDAPVVRSADPVVPSEAGRRLASTGSAELRVQACDNCHGPAGAGGPPAIPYLAGQGATYLIAALNAFRSGLRRNDEGDQMAMVASALSPEAIVAVSRYYASLAAPPPGPVDRIAPAPMAAAQPAAPDSLAVAAPGTAGPAASAGGAGTSAADVPPPVPAPSGLAAADPARGRAILGSRVHGCAGCHTIPGVRGANGVVGPPLNGMSSRGFVAGQLPNRPDVLVAFLEDPPGLLPGTGMPRTGLTRDEARHVAAYLYTLEP